jgi:hypothetical protein
MTSGYLKSLENKLKNNAMIDGSNAPGLGEAMVRNCVLIMNQLLCSYC